MSMKTWKEEFFSRKPSKRMPKKQAIEHSLRKWIGLREKNLKKHGMHIYVTRLVETGEAINCMQIGSESCALCIKYIDENPILSACEKCPLYKSLGHECDGYGRNRPYSMFIDYGDVEPMIEALKKTLREAK